VREDQAVPILGTLSAEGGAIAGRLRARDLPGARVHLELALAGDPDRVAALNDLAVTYYLDGRFESARQLLDEVVVRGGPREQQVALVNLGELYALEGYLAAAQAHFESARGIDPGRPAPHYALALLADLRGDYPASITLLREAVRLDESGTSRGELVFAFDDERNHLEALLAEVAGDRLEAQERWAALRSSRFPTLAAAAARRLTE
jgi:tetratricopeptide (TPR) repeat protein